ncbi:hypothetical protein Q9966_009326 [Columba livia]|nr:hypothetical protein Q9966_009326 [Columba livia]
MDPKLLDLTLGVKIPVTPGSKPVFSRGKLGEKLHRPSGSFDLGDPLGHRMSNEYNSLHDPHLQAYHQRKDNVQWLKRQGLVTSDGNVVCSLKEFNQYRQYRTMLKLEAKKASIREQLGHRRQHLGEAATGPMDPKLLDLTLGVKIPVTPGSKPVFSRGKLGEKLHRPSGSFDLGDPLGHRMSNEYNSLHDPHLQAYHQRKDNVQWLKRQGLVTSDGNVVCSLKEFNQYRQYRTMLKLEAKKASIREQLGHRRQHLGEAATGPMDPKLLDLTLGVKIPVTPGSKPVFSRGKLGEKLHRPSGSFDLGDPLGHRMSNEYNSLHDPHLQAYHQRKDNVQWLKRQGLVTSDGNVVCSLKEFNQYRQYRTMLKLEAKKASIREQLGHRRQHLGEAATGPMDPKLLDLTLGVKIPVTPGSKPVFSRGKLGEKLHRPSGSFDLGDPLGHRMSNEYNSLHDPHLQAYHQRKDNVQWLKRQGLVTSDGNVVCSLKEFNQYRQYRTMLKLEAKKASIREQPGQTVSGICLQSSIPFPPTVSVMLRPYFTGNLM